MARRVVPGTAAGVPRAQPPPTRPVDTGGSERGFILESVAEGTETLRRLSVQPLPFRIGRQAGLELVLPSDRVSKVHAEIFERDGKLHIRDRESRNGTFVNHQRVISAEIAEGDIIHLGDFEFRIGRDDASATPDAKSNHHPGIHFANR